MISDESDASEEIDDESAADEESSESDDDEVDEKEEELRPLVGYSLRLIPYLNAVYRLQF